MSFEADALGRLLAEAFALPAPGARPLSGFTARPFDGGGWYQAYTVEARLEDGTVHRLFLKDLGAPKAEKGDMVARRERERCVYQRLLDPELDGTARLYGVEWDPDASRYWLLLEFVDGVPVRHQEMDAWRCAAAWLARFQAGSERRESNGDACALLRRDERFFLATAHRAVDAVSTRSPALGEGVGGLVEEYVSSLLPLVRQRPTLVHGAFMPMQILTQGGGSDRVCPVDWELAGLGPPAYDLGFLAYGFRGPKRHELLAAYADEAARLGLPVPEDLSEQVRVMEIHRTLMALAQSEEREYDDQAVADYLDVLESLGTRGASL